MPHRTPVRWYPGLVPEKVVNRAKLDPAKVDPAKLEPAGWTQRSWWSGSAGAQPPQHLARPASRAAHRVHRALRLGQELSGLRHYLRRGPAALRRVAVQLRPPVPRPDGQAGRRFHRRVCLPAISIDQKSASRNPRSTVGTITEIYDYLRLLYARVGIPHCPRDGTVVQRQTPQQIVDRILELPDGTRFQVLAPVVRGRKGEYQSLLEELLGPGLRPGPDRRRGLRVDRTAQAGPLRDPHHRGDR